MASWVWNGFKSAVHECARSMEGVSKGEETRNAALAAEDTVGGVLESFGCSVYLRKRVYVPEQRQKREIDCIALVNRRVLVIEVKNWRGHVWCNGNRWFHQASGESGGKTRGFGNLVCEADMKTRCFWRHFEYAHKVRLPEEAFVTVVVFASELARLDPDVFKQHRNVFTLATFTEYIEAEMRRESMPRWLFTSLCSVVQWACGGHAHVKRLSAAHVSKVRAVCQKIPTWDVITFLKGAVEHGDVIAVELPSVGLSLTRSNVRDLKIIWNAGGWRGLLQSVRGGSACSVKVIPAGDALKKPQGVVHERVHSEGNRRARPAGPSPSSPSHSQPSNARSAAKPLLNVFDYTNGDGSVEFPVFFHNDNMLRNDRLVFQKAGNSTSTIIPLYELRIVELCANRSAMNDRRKNPEQSVLSSCVSS